MKTLGKSPPGLFRGNFGVWRCDPTCPVWRQMWSSFMRPGAGWSTGTRYIETLCHMCPSGVRLWANSTHLWIGRWWWPNWFTYTFVYFVVWDNNQNRATRMFPSCSASTQISKVSFASDVEVMESQPNLPSPGEVPDSPDWPVPNRESLLWSNPSDALNHEQPAFTIATPAYALFPFADPFDEGVMWSTPRYPSLPAPPGFAQSGQPGALPGPAGIAARDWSSFIWPELPS